MAWHRDDAAYSEPQVEAIVTVDVSGGFDGKTQWRMPDGRVVGEVLEPNSLLLVQAEGPEHEVTTVTRGQRTIVKAIFVSSFERNGEFARLSRAAAGAAADKSRSAAGSRTKRKYKQRR